MVFQISVKEMAKASKEMAVVNKVKKLSGRVEWNDQGKMIKD